MNRKCVMGIKSAVFYLFLGLFFCSFFMMSQYAFADAMTIGSLATTVVGSMSGLAKLITAAAYVAGMGFAMAAILKFKAHKDNPTQIPVGTPIALFFIAAALIFLPVIFGTAGQTIFGSSSTSNSVSGVASF